MQSREGTVQIVSTPVSVFSVCINYTLTNILCIYYLYTNFAVHFK